ncbi:MAG: twin-arginine translocation signal domain-containing protein [Schwartzia sp.]|nr:twin-arginine translocation signal domain-containing protein [Schwartzia sp. (in: firmicutes)]
MKRRDFLRLTGAAAAAALFGRVSSVSAANTDFVKGRRVDFHSHAILPSYSEGLKRLGIDAAAEEGFFVTAEHDAPNIIHTMEIYRDADAYKKYVESPEYKAFLPKLSSIFISAHEVENRPAHIVLSTKGFQ